MLGEALRLLRVFHDTKQVELCSELGFSKSYLSEIESGKKNPTLNVVNKYSDYFGISASKIMLFSEKIDGFSKKSEIHRIKSMRKILVILAWIAKDSDV